MKRKNFRGRDVSRPLILKPEGLKDLMRSLVTSFLGMRSRGKTPRPISYLKTMIVFLVPIMLLVMTAGCATIPRMHVGEPLRMKRVISVDSDQAWSGIVRTVSGEGAVIKSTDRSLGYLRLSQSFTQEDLTRYCDKKGGRHFKSKLMTEGFIDISILIRSDQSGTSELVMNSRCLALFDPPKSNVIYSIGPMILFAYFNRAAALSTPAVFQSTGQFENDLYEKIRVALDLDSRERMGE